MIPRSGNQPPTVKVQSGATIDALMNFLEQQPGGKGAAPGYSFPHIPATGNLTIGGVLAINGHGTAIPVHREDICTSYGSLSTHSCIYSAVVADPDGATPDRYAIREFKHGEGDDRAFLAHLGRAFLLDATLDVIDNYNMRGAWANDEFLETVRQALATAEHTSDWDFYVQTMLLRHLPITAEVVSVNTRLGFRRHFFQRPSRTLRLNRWSGNVYRTTPKQMRLRLVSLGAITLNLRDLAPH
jgi:FAD/FMN-containing dehydrogenase